MEHNWKAKYKYVGYTASVAVAVDKKNKHRGQFESESKRHRRRRTRHQRHKRLAMETKHEGQLHKADTASSVSGWPWPSGDRFEKENLIRRALPKYLWISVGCWTLEVCCQIDQVLAITLPVLILLVVSFISNWHLAPASFKDENQEGKVFNSVAFHNLLFHCSSYCMRRMHKEINCFPLGNSMTMKLISSRSFSRDIVIASARHHAGKFCFQWEMKMTSVRPCEIWGWASLVLSPMWLGVVANGMQS